MSKLPGVAGGESPILDENNLPVELQTRNVINPTYIISSAVNGAVKNLQTVASKGSLPKEQPYVVISEQPQQRGFRFRYECEGPSHGGLQGTKSERSRKSYPSIKIGYYSGAARVVVSLVTDEKSPRAHAHKLVGTNCKSGLCTLEIKANSETISFPNLCILHVTRRKLTEVLTDRILDAIKLNKKLKENNMNFDPPITDEDRVSARQQAEEQSKTMQLNVVRLCFQVFLRNPDGTFSKMLTPVVTQPIYDSKSPGASALKICRMDKYGGCCSGNEEVFLLCEKVQKDDILVRFVEQNPDGSVKWEAYGNFGPLDVHRQYAIVFKTPAYYDTNIDKAVNVLIMLQRKSDLEVSEPKAFTYFPQNRDKDNIASKKRKRIPLDGYDFGDGGMGGAGIGGDGAGGLGGAGGGGGGLGPGEKDIRGEQGNNVLKNQIMFLSSREMFSEPAATPDMKIVAGLPVSVEEAVKEAFETEKRVLDSERLVEELRLNDSSQSCVFLGKVDPDDIQVDSAVVLPRTARQGKSSPDKQNGEKKSAKKDSEEKIAVNVAKPDWLDSGVDPGSTKSIVSLDEKAEKKATLSVIDASVHRAVVSLCSSRDGVKSPDSKSAPVSDSQSEPDVKLDVVSEGVRSDEGFSETSEDASSKTQLLSSKGLNVTLPISSASVTAPNSCSLLTDAARQVTGRVAERTLVALTDYAETGDIRHLLMVQRHLMTISNENGDLPLHLAVINSQPKALRNILDVICTLPQSERHINSLNLMRQTPLHLAAVMQEQSMVEMLLHTGADPTIADRNGNTPAHLAVIYQSAQCLDSLVKFLRPGRSKTYPFPELDYMNYDGYSPVHLAVNVGSVAMLQTLVFGKADVNLPDGKSGKTGLHHAVENGNLTVAGYLLMEAQTDVNARCFDGNTALHIACARQLVGMVALLVTAGANTECENEEIPDTEPGDTETGGLDKRGLRPEDYADNNEQILRILYGEYNDDDNSNFESCLCASPEPASLLGPTSGSDGISTVYGSDIFHSCQANPDVTMMAPKLRMELSRLLDPDKPGQDVRALADILGYSNLKDVLERVRSKGTSPTAFLLEYYETMVRSLDDLKQGLVSIHREEVAALISSPQ